MVCYPVKVLVRLIDTQWPQAGQAGWVSASVCTCTWDPGQSLASREASQPDFQLINLRTPLNFSQDKMSLVATTPSRRCRENQDPICNFSSSSSIQPYRSGIPGRLPSHLPGDEMIEKPDFWAEPTWRPSWYCSLAPSGHHVSAMAALHILCRMNAQARERSLGMLSWTVGHTELDPRACLGAIERM